MKARKPNQKLRAWIDARKRHHLSHVHVQMARELGMNPAKLGKVDNHRQEPWKLSRSQFTMLAIVAAVSRASCA